MNQKTPLVSVVIPCYNAEKYVQAAITSVLNQTYTHLEVILINDGSTDQTGQILMSFLEQDQRVKVFHNEQNKGLIYTLNKGAELATGEYIARMDADDICIGERIEKQVKFMIDHPEIDLISAGFSYMDYESNVIHSIAPKAVTSEGLKFISFFCTPVVHPSVLCKSSIMKQHKYDSQYIHSEDYELFSRLLLNGKLFSNIDEPLIMYRINPEGVSNTYEVIQTNVHRTISSRNIKWYFDFTCDERVHRIIVNRINFSPTKKEVFQAIGHLKSFRRIYTAKEQLNKQTLREIRRFTNNHIIDILIQSIKNVNGADKMVIGILGLITKPSLLSYYNLKYLRSKLKLSSRRR